MRRVAVIVGTRPNLVKLAALWHALSRRPSAFEVRTLHTGQHHDPAMFQELLDDLDLPRPDVSLPPQKGARTEQIARMLVALEEALSADRPDLVIVVGDVNSTAAGALAARVAGLPVAHVEAGLRSFDRSMPEETNRILVDALSDPLFASERSGVENLLREGRPERSIHHVGNVMIDTLVRVRGRRSPTEPRAAGPYAVLTLHRPHNVDDPARLSAFLDAAIAASKLLPVVLPAHPRTQDRLRRHGFARRLEEAEGLRVLPPMRYPRMIELLEGATVVLTDSGGLQEECSFLGVPCLTLRDATERPATVTHGTNRVIGADPPRLLPELERVLAGDAPPKRCPALWDGHAAERIADVLESGSR